MGCYLLWNDTPNAANAPAMNRSGETMEELPQNIVVRLIGAADGGVTTVSEELRAERDEWTPAAAWYDLQGRKLNGKPSKSGLYVNHGKKILIK